MKGGPEGNFNEGVGELFIDPSIKADADLEDAVVNDLGNSSIEGDEGSELLPGSFFNDGFNDNFPKKIDGSNIKELFGEYPPPGLDDIVKEGGSLSLNQ